MLCSCQKTRTTSSGRRGHEVRITLFLRFGLRLNVKKAEYMTTDENEKNTIHVDGTELLRNDFFRYLGSTLLAYGSLDHELLVSTLLG